MPPFVSIILPVRNEELFITSCLKSISAQDYPKEQIEVLIAEGMSDDDTLGSIAEYDSIDEDLAITVLKNQKQTVSAGLNLGFKNARGDVLIRMDAHAKYGCDYISQCLAVMERTGAANVGGPALALPGNDSAMAQAIALAHHSPFGLGGGAFRNPKAEGFVETVWPGCFKREVFDKVGYIDERRSRTEDIEFNSRLLAAGYKIYLSPLIKAWYYCRSTLWETWRQRWADGFEITRFLPDNPKAPRLRHFIPLIFVSSLILLSALSLSGLGAALWGRGAGTKLANLLHGFKGLNQLPGSVTFSNGSNVSNVSNLRVWSWHLLFLRLLALELFAYFSAMLFFVCQAGRSVQRAASSKQGATRGVEVKRFETVGEPGAEEAPGFPIKPGMTRRTGPDKDSIFSIQNSEFKPGSLALLPVVFLTLHFSYGLGSLWGLISLPYWAATKQKR